jgi:hypothetical protein
MDCRDPGHVQNRSLRFLPPGVETGQQARIMVGAAAKKWHQEFGHALADYSPTADEVIIAFKLYRRSPPAEAASTARGNIYAADGVRSFL